MTTYNLYCSNHGCFEPATRLIVFASAGQRMGVCDRHAGIWTAGSGRQTVAYDSDETRPLEWEEITLVKRAPGVFPGHFFKLPQLIGWKTAPVAQAEQYDQYLQGKLADPRD